MERTSSPAATRGSSSLALWFDCSESCCRVTRALPNYLMDAVIKVQNAQGEERKKKKQKNSRTNQPNCSQMQYGNLAIPANALGRRFLEINFATMTSSSDITYKNPPTSTPSTLAELKGTCVRSSSRTQLLAFWVYFTLYSPGYSVPRLEWI